MVKTIGCDVMAEGEVENQSLKDYRNAQIRFHMELMNICRRYINDLDIASILGIIDIVKRETIDLEGATKHKLSKEDFLKNDVESGNSYF